MLLSFHASAGVLSVSIQEEMGRPAAARVYLAGATGAPVLPKNTIVYDKVRPDGVGERHFVPRGGAFTTEVLRASTSSQWRGARNTCLNG